MKKHIAYILMVALMVTMVLTTTAASFAITYDKVAGSGDMSSVEEVGLEGMFPIYADDIKEGTYDITVESSSAMFTIEKATLTVKDGEMTAVMTMGGKGYLKVFMGSGNEAAAADISEYIDFVEDEDGNHTYTVPVEALDMAIPCAAFSKNKEQWYERSLLFEAKSLPADAVLVELPDYDALEKAARDKRIEEMKEEEANAPEAVTVDLEDGEYTVEVDLEGGSGRASITSPAVLIVKEGKAYARIEWSSSNYDYMLIGDEKYLPVQTEGNSTFELPITVFDEAMEVVADTTAMGTPHEIEYTLLFHSDSLPSQGNTVLYVVIGVVIVAILAAGIVIYRKKKQK